MKKTWWPLDHHLWQQLKQFKLQNERVIVALSGGPDSVALAQSFYKVLGPDKVTIAHFHHGGISSFRDQALEYCQTFAEARSLTFIPHRWAGENLKSEAAMRKVRYEFLMKIAEKDQVKVIATGHHAQDVLETRLIRLIRGTGSQGLPAIRSWRPPFFRPFLDISKTKLAVFLNKENLLSLTDPSNSDNFYLRNWLRQTWLPQLEAYKSGSCDNLGRSLENIVHTLNHEVSTRSLDFIARAEFLAQTETEQRRWLAAVLLHKGMRNFTQFHLDEVRRRVLQSPKTNTFKVAGCQWQVNAEQIKVQPL